jgi:hypothetical protein
MTIFFFMNENLVKKGGGFCYELAKLNTKSLLYNPSGMQRFDLYQKELGLCFPNLYSNQDRPSECLPLIAYDKSVYIYKRILCYLPG